MSKLHFSEKLFAMAPCRAKDGQCPFTQHGDADMAALADQYRKLHENGEAVPGVSSNSGEIKHFQFLDDGTFKLGKRHFTKEGELIPTASTVRSRRRRERLRGATTEDEPEFVEVRVPTYDEKILAELDAYVDSHPLKPMGEEQAINAVKIIGKRYREDDFEKWMDTDNSRKIAALQLVQEKWDSDRDAAIRILHLSGVLEIHQRGDEYSPETYRLPGGGEPSFENRYTRVDARNIKNSLLWHRRTDRSTLFVAIGEEPDADANVIHTILADGLKQRMDHEAEQEAEEKEKARLAAPIDWKKMTKAQLFRDVGDTFDPTNRHHLEIEQILVDMGKDRTALWLDKAGFRYNKTYLEYIVKWVLRTGKEKQEG